MTHSFDVLIDGKVYVGSADDAQAAVNEKLVDHVYDVRVNGREGEVPYNYTHSPIEENNEASTIKAGALKIADAIRSGEAVYIHCGSGTGRAAVMAVATLMELDEASTVEQAIQTVSEKRKGARFQPEMVAALEKLYK